MRASAAALRVMAPADRALEVTIERARVAHWAAKTPYLRRLAAAAVRTAEARRTPAALAAIHDFAHLTDIAHA
jgi:hypothetical protein